MRARAVEWTGWAAGAAAALIAVGGSASHPGGWLLAAPPLAKAGMALAALVALRAMTGGGGGRLFLGTAPLVLLVLVGVTVSGVAPWAGPPLAVLVLAAAVGALLARPPRWAATTFLPVVALVYLGGAARVQEQVGPQGDEPHYLLVADSLIRDGDLGLSRDYVQERYRGFHPGPLVPHYRVRGRGGEIYSLHALGLSLLVLPAYAVGSYWGASFFMAGLGVWLARELRLLLRTWLEEGAEGAAWVLALSPPLVHYAGLVFTEVPAALIVAIALRHARGTSARAALAVGTAVAFLPWLNVRYAILAAALIAFALVVARGLAAVAWLVPSAVSAVLIALHHFRLYGFFDPRRVYGRRPELAFAGLPTGVPGLLFDQEFGLLVYAPVFALAVPGLVLLWRRSRVLALVVCVLAASVMGVAGAWPMWRGGFNPPARFLVPVVPALGLALAARWQRGISAPAALLVGWSLWTGAVGTWDRTLVHRDRDTTAPLLRAASGAEEWTRLLPGYVLLESEPDRAKLTAVWAVALLVAVVRRGSPARVTATGLAAASVALVVASGVASRLSSAVTAGRDAVRVIGRPAVRVPGWEWMAAAPGVWETRALPWGPVYEPHRARSGAIIGHRLHLPPGGYRITIRGEAVPSDLPPPVLGAAGPAGGSRSNPLTATPEGLTGSFAVPPGHREITLWLQDGGPFVMKEFQLDRVSTLPAAGGPILSEDRTAHAPEPVGPPGSGRR